MWADFGILKVRQAEHLITLWIWSRRTHGEPARRALQQSSLERTRGASKESITTVKSGENKGSQQGEHYNSQVWREQGEPARRALQQSSLERTWGASKESITTVKSGENKGSQQGEHYNSQVWREQGEPARRALQQSSLERTRGASKESITTVKSGENKGSQQGEHYNSQVWREQGEPARRALQQSSLERTREETRVWVASKERYWWIEPIHLISRYARWWSLFNCFFSAASWLSKMTPRVQAALQNGMSPRPTQCEDQFQEQSLSEEYLFYRHWNEKFSSMHMEKWGKLKHSHWLVLSTLTACLSTLITLSSKLC